MKFSELATYFEKMEATSSRLTITHLISDLFKKLNSEEIEKTVYLLQGRVAPIFEKIEFGMAEKMIQRSILAALNLKKEEFLKEYRKFGDLGKTTEFFKKIKKTPGENLSILAVYDKLNKLAGSGGEGSQEVKLQILADLIKKIDPLSSRYLVRIPAATMRLGFSDMTVLDAFSWMLHGDKSLRPAIEKAYHVRPDLGLIGSKLKEHGISGLKEIKPKIFTPILMMRAERLSSGKEILEKIGKCSVEPKYDGFRCISGYTPIYVKDKGYISVRDVHPGDMVLTHKGRFMRVITKNKRKVEKGERVFRLQTYLGDKLKISEQHKILTWNNGKTIWKPIEKIKIGDQLAFPKPKLYEFPKKGLINPHLLLVDESGYQKTIESNQDFYKLLGFWLGDGFTNDFHNTERIGLVFNARKEKDLAYGYKKIISSLLKIPKISENQRQGALTLYWRDKPLRIWLSRYFRRDWRGKTLPQWFTHISKANFLAFLKGWIESDGSPCHGGGYKIVTKERDLAAFAQLVALHHGIIVGLHKIRCKITNRNFIGTYYQLVIPGTDRYAKIEKDWIIVRVMKNDAIKRDPRLSLYNLQVEGDKSYCSGLTAFHNCQIHKSGNDVKIFSRNLENVTYMYPDVVNAVKNQVNIGEVILEGEAIGFNPKTGEFLPFQETVQRKRKYGIEAKAKEVPLKLFVFELLYADGKNYINTHFEERRKKLATIIAAKEGTAKSMLVLAPDEIVSDEKKLELIFDDALSKGLEGIVAKKLDGIYQPGARGWNWIKFKRSYSAKIHDTIDCLVMGYDVGQGKRAGFGIGAFLVGVYDKKDRFVTVAKIGTGLTDEEWRQLRKRADKLKTDKKPALYEVNKLMDVDVWIKPSLVVEIKADEITRSPVHTAGLALRFPRLEKFRDDRRPEDATNLTEVEKMFKSQGKK